MSQYLNLFLRSKGGVFLPLGDYSRSTAVYRLFSEQVPYEKVKALSESDLRELRSFAITEISACEKEIQKTKQLISDIKELTNTDLQDKIDSIIEYRDVLEENQRYKEEAQEVLILVGLLQEAMDSVRYFDEESPAVDADHYIYAGIECSMPTEEDIESYH